MRYMTLVLGIVWITLLLAVWIAENKFEFDYFVKASLCLAWSATEFQLHELRERIKNG